MRNKTHQVSDVEHRAGKDVEQAMSRRASPRSLSGRQGESGSRVSQESLSSSLQGNSASGEDGCFRHDLHEVY